MLEIIQKYKRQKEKQREVQQKKYDAQQKEIARLNELIEKFKHKPKKASMARAKKKYWNGCSGWKDLIKKRHMFLKKS